MVDSESLKAVAKGYPAVVKLANEATDYYRKQLYINDKCAKGQAFHEPLLKAFETHLAATSALRSELMEWKRTLELETLKSIEAKRGKDLEWEIRNTVLVLEHLFMALPRATEELAAPAKLFVARAKKAKAALDELEAVYDATDGMQSRALVRKMAILNKSLSSAQAKLERGESLDHWDVNAIRGDFQGLLSDRKWLKFELPLVILVP